MKKNMLKILGLFLMVCVPFVFWGCVQANIDSFVDPSFNPSTTPLKRIAVFPLRNARLASSESQAINAKISLGVHNFDNSIDIMSAEEATTILENKNLIDSWSKCYETYLLTGILNKSILDKVGTALGVDAILIGELTNVSPQQAGVLHPISLYDTYFDSNTSKITVIYSLISIPMKKQIWEARSDGNSDESLSDAINCAIDKIIDSIPQQQVKPIPTITEKTEKNTPPLKESYFNKH